MISGNANPFLANQTCSLDISLDSYQCRCGFCYLELEHVPAGIYNVIPTTFLPKQEGPFFLDISSAAPLRVSQLQWRAGGGWMGGPWPGPKDPWLGKDISGCPFKRVSSLSRVTVIKGYIFMAIDWKLEVGAMKEFGGLIVQSCSPDMGIWLKLYKKQTSTWPKWRWYLFSGDCIPPKRERFISSNVLNNDVFSRASWSSASERAGLSVCLSGAGVGCTLPLRAPPMCPLT